MKCHTCKRAIAAGIEQRKMIAEYRQPDGTVVAFGLLMPAGPLSQATGQILRAFHGKCFYNTRRREARAGDTGVFARVPSAYDPPTHQKDDPCC